MNKYKKLIPVIAIVLVALGVNLEQFGIDLNDFTGETTQSTPASQATQKSSTPAASNMATQNVGPAAHWSNTTPKINLWHVFEGEVNRKGKPVGFHSRPGGADPANARLVSVKSRPNHAGVYTANIEVRDQQQWKSKFSSFFPDDMNQTEVINAILNAYKNSKNPKKQPWSGPSGRGFQIQGYTLSRGDINTAFPVFVKGQ